MTPWFWWFPMTGYWVAFGLDERVDSEREEYLVQELRDDLELQSPEDLISEAGEREAWVWGQVRKKRLQRSASGVVDEEGM